MFMINAGYECLVKGTNNVLLLRLLKSHGWRELVHAGIPSPGATTTVNICSLLQSQRYRCASSSEYADYQGMLLLLLLFVLLLDLEQSKCLSAYEMAEFNVSCLCSFVRTHRVVASFVLLGLVFGFHQCQLVFAEF